MQYRILVLLLLVLGAAYSLQLNIVRYRSSKKTFVMDCIRSAALELSLAIVLS